ncbi:MAG: FkbM family methyltransferase [Hyphomicrobium sp.]
MTHAFPREGYVPPPKSALRKFLHRHALRRRARQAAASQRDFAGFDSFRKQFGADAASQLGQDLWALWLTNGKRGGYFVEIGASDGVSLSNTYILERDFGWRGIVAEPHPSLASALAANRRCHVSTDCVSDRSGDTVEFLALKDTVYSRLKDIVPDDDHEKRGARAIDANVVRVRTISLNDLLAQANAPGTIDFLSIDTEGSELEILNAFDFDAYTTRAIVVEHNFTSRRRDLFELLESKGYMRLWPEHTLWDDWYVKDDSATPRR